MHKLVLVRHGESVWNKENRFTGWVDVDLSEKGVQEAKDAGLMIRDAGLEFDICYTSMLKRAIKTWWLAMDQLDRLWVPVERSWRLNERHYGNLQGLNKTEMVEKFGEAQVKIWRRSYDTPPPPLEENDQRHPKYDPRYKNMRPSDLPRTECLKDTVERFLPFWDQAMAPALRGGIRVGVFAHGNSIRALVKYLDKISDDAITEVNIPTGIPLVYELDQNLSPLKKYYLADEEKVSAAIQAVANQTKKQSHKS